MIKKLLYLAFSVLLLVSSAYGAVAYDAVATTTKVVSSPGSANPNVTWTHTVTSNTNGVVFVFINEWGGASNTIGDNVYVTAVTYAGNSCTLKNTFSPSTTRAVEVWYCIAPATGASTVSVTWDDADNPGISNPIILTGNLTSISVTGADQTTPIIQAVNGTGSTSPSTKTLTSGSANNLLIDNANVVEGSSAMSITVSAGQSSKANHVAGTNGSRNIQGVSTKAATAASQTMSWTESANRAWNEVVIEVQAPVSNTNHFLGSLGVGA